MEVDFCNEYLISKSNEPNTKAIYHHAIINGSSALMKNLTKNAESNFKLASLKTDFKISLPRGRKRTIDSFKLNQRISTINNNKCLNTNSRQ